MFRRILGARCLATAGLVVLAALVLDGPVEGKGKDPRTQEAAVVNPVMTILFDNVPYADGFRTSWGYSCLIQGLEETILFDTGADGRILLDNLAAVGVNPNDIDVIILSHFHGDHTGGLHALLPKCDDVTVYLLRTFPEGFKTEVRSMASNVIEVSGSFSIIGGVHTTGILGFEIPEQSLVIETDEGLIVVTGCAHPGLRGIVEKSREVTMSKPVFLMGGFHLRDYSKAEVTDLVEDLKTLGVRAMAPSHCTGGAQRHIIETILGERCLDAGAGRVITMEEIRNTLN